MSLNFLKKNKQINIAEKFNPKKGKKNMPPFLLFIIDIIKLIIIAFLIVWPIHKFIFQPFYVVGASMEPSFYNKDYLIIDKLSYNIGKPGRGDVAIFISPKNSNNFLIKRVIGLPGERVVIENNKIEVFNNKYPEGKVLSESYLNAGDKTRGSVDVRLKPGEYYLLGDNRNMSLDSRIFGPVKEKNIIGRAWVRGWPLKEAGFIKETENLN